MKSFRGIHARAGLADQPPLSSRPNRWMVFCRSAYMYSCSSIHMSQFSTVRIVREGETCEARCLNPTKVRRISKQLPKSDTLIGLSDLFKSLSDPTRIRILFSLSKEEVCVCDLSALLGMSDSAVSHQLRLLRALRLVKSRKEGRVVYYSLTDDHVTKLLEMCLEHENE